MRIDLVGIQATLNVFLAYSVRSKRKMKKPHLVGYFLIVVVLGTLLVLLSELFLIIKGRFKPNAQDGLDYSAMALAFDSKYTVEELREMRPLTMDHLKYRPWVQFGNYDHSNKYSVVQRGIRKTVSNEVCKGANISAWFFGGSTMYGAGVPWWDSIPSQFAEHAKKHGFCVTATNYGVPYFYSAQEGVYFYIELLRTKQRPNFVIFLDGLNDFLLPGSSMKIEPFFTPVLESAIPYGSSTRTSSVGISFFERFATYQFIRSKFFGYDGIESASKRNSLIPNSAAGVSKNDAVDHAAREIVKNYISTRMLLRGICSDQKITCVQFLQPVAIKDYRPPVVDTLTEEFRNSNSDSYSDDRQLVLAGYAYLLKESAADIPEKGSIDYGISFFDISDSLSHYQGIAYIDSVHYSPRAIDAISKRMVDTILK